MATVNPSPQWERRKRQAILRGKRCGRCGILYDTEFPRARYANECIECAERRPWIQIELALTRFSFYDLMWND